ncbi:MAG: FMN-binding protein [Kiritimatiellae bacterium]|nr:FMN-binding protein [Kiritimatiellia bacterium]
MSSNTSKWKMRLFTVGFMFVVTFVCISVVAGVHLRSRERVLRNETLYEKRGIMAAAGLDVPADGAAVLAWYGSCVTPVPDGENPACYEVRESAQGAHGAMVFMREGAGLWGTIRAVIGLDPSLSRFTGIAFVAQNETPGLGARIMEAWYRDHIKGKSGGLTLVGEKSGSTNGAELDAITGATITSTAVRDILNRLIEEAPALVESAWTESDATGIR